MEIIQSACYWFFALLPVTTGLTHYSEHAYRAMQASVAQQMAVSATQAAAASASGGIATGATAATAASVGVVAKVSAAIAGASFATQFGAAMGVALVAGGIAAVSSGTVTISRQDRSVVIVDHGKNTTLKADNDTLSQFINATLLEPPLVESNLSDVVGDMLDETMGVSMDDGNILLGEEGTLASMMYCDGLKEIGELKEGRANFVIEGFPDDFVSGHREQMQDLFVLVYNGLSGMCDGEYQRIVQNATMENINTIQGGPNKYYTYTQWLVMLTCAGCPDDNPLFPVLSSSSFSESRRLDEPAVSLMQNTFFYRVCGSLSL
jgi:hypothetical protein